MFRGSFGTLAFLSCRHPAEHVAAVESNGAPEPQARDASGGHPAPNRLLADAEVAGDVPQGEEGVIQRFHQRSSSSFSFVFQRSIRSTPRRRIWKLSSRRLSPG